MMPKKREAKDEDVDVLGLLPPHKRHKKHKHKKHKRKRGGTDQEEEAPSPPASPQSGDGSKPALKLKIKIGGQQALEKNVTRADEPSSHSEDEEEAWLEALESGRLEEVDDELRKMKDPTLMTARQRALLESKSKDKDEDGPVQVEPIKEMTEEMIQRRMQRAKKRKQQAEEKKEKDKKQTIERLLKKSESRLRASKKPAKKADTPKAGLAVGMILVGSHANASPWPPPLLATIRLSANSSGTTTERDFAQGRDFGRALWQWRRRGKLVG
ncbi:uncharacterized protein LOC142586056 isoform X3 [Dermacentor variabilis]|uniref:uncharacterized protein LOC142586056 isoform X3 n=1 Tax=Dermacentor variabilis TaxID=34621 RepID=UPI003F5C97D2